MVSTIAGIIGPLHMNVAVEGHTDSHAFVGRGGYTNWELSADRANSARRLLQEHGVEPRRVVEIRGYADSKPRFPENPADPRNRRISIIVFSRLHGQAAAVEAGTLAPKGDENPAPPPSAH
jgi:chemotaxis protein MotB